MRNFKTPALLLVIFILALLLRTFGLDWDQSQHLHPDERFLTMVATDISLPSSLENYFNTSNSPLNPYNYPNYQFFVYGTFPLFVTKYLAHWLSWDNYGQLYLLGRILSALFDSFNVILLFLLSRLVFPKKIRKIYLFLPSIAYTFTVLPLQLSHFFAVDTYLTFFLLTAFTGLAAYLHRPKFIYLLLSSLAYGLALSSKISAAYFAPIIALFFLIFLIKSKKFFSFLPYPISYLLIAILIFRLTQPYAFIGLANLNPQFIDNLKTLASYNKPDANFPPSVQWLSKTPLLFPFQNLLLWGIGLPLFLPFIILLVLYLIKFKKTQFFDSTNLVLILALVWILFLFIFQGIQFTHAMRYFLPIYPFILLLLFYLFSRFSLSFKIILPLLILHLLWGLAFIGIYSRPQSRVSASLDIYRLIPDGSVLTNEYWDDPLPLYLPGYDPGVYHGLMLSLFDTDSPEKWLKISSYLESADYLIMSSNRLWGSIPLVPDRYPQTAVFYQQLFDGQLPFNKYHQVLSYPGFSLPFVKNCYYFGPSNYPYKTRQNKWFDVDDKCSFPGIYIRDDIAEETFTVYDHPQVLIFSRQK